MHNFTTDDLLVYLYNDQPLCDNTESLQDALQKSWSLQQKLSVLEESVACLNNITLQQPQNKTIEAVLQYADLAIHVS